MAACFSCGEKINTKAPVGRRDSCDRCGADLRCCRNCAHYDVLAAHECREPVAEAVKEKDRSNFCDFFELADREFKSQEDPSMTARRKLEEIFKKK